MALKPMLAAQFEEHRVRNQLPMFIQPKFDGIRALMYKGQLLSRSFKPIPNKHIRTTIEAQKDLLEGLDGELIIGRPNDKDVYRRTNSAVMSHNGEPTFRYYVFDIADPSTSYINRHNALVHMIASLRNREEGDPLRWIYPVETFPCLTLDEIREYEARFIAEGYEGAILRGVNHGYKFGRATPAQGQLVKIKRYVDAEATVIGFDELMHNDNTATKSELGYTVHSSHKDGMRPGNTLGALKCRGQYADGTVYEVDLGTGFSQAERQEIWDNRKSYEGKIAKFKYFEVGMKDKPRHPVFLGWRHADDM